MVTGGRQHHTVAWEPPEVMRPANVGATPHIGEPSAGLALKAVELPPAHHHAGWRQRV
jgi:hypothetical protein